MFICETFLPDEAAVRVIPGLRCDGVGVVTVTRHPGRVMPRRFGTPPSYGSTPVRHIFAGSRRVPMSHSCLATRVAHITIAADVSSLPCVRRWLAITWRVASGDDRAVVAAG